MSIEAKEYQRSSLMFGVQYSNEEIEYINEICDFYKSNR